MMNPSVTCECTKTMLMASLLLALLPVNILAADNEFKPVITVSEEYNDNVFDTKSDKRSDFITRLQPGVNFKYNTPLWNWDGAYFFDYRSYVRNSKGDEYNHNLGLKGNISLIDNFFYLDLSDNYSRVSLDKARDFTQDSYFINQTEQNTARISPYLLWRLNDKASLKTGYRYLDTRYWGEGIDRSEHNAFADLEYELTPGFKLTAGYQFARLDSPDIRFSKHDLSGGFKYEYSNKSYVSVKIGNSWQKFDDGLDVNYLFWDATVNSDFDFAVATFATRVSTNEDPLAVTTRETSYSGKLEKTLQRGTVGLSAVYSEYVNTYTDSRDSRKLSFVSNGRYDIGHNLNANLVLTAERVSQKSVNEYPYRFSGSGGFNYLLNNGLTVGLNYTYVTFLYNLDNTANSKQINRVVLDMKKDF